MVWFGKSFIKFCRSFINLIKLVKTRTCSSVRAREYPLHGPCVLRATPNQQKNLKPKDDSKEVWQLLRALCSSWLVSNLA